MVGAARTEFQNACTSTSGTIGTADCATANRAGSCSLSLAAGVAPTFTPN